MDGLKPCPFCGGEAEIRTERRWISGVSNGYRWKVVTCKKCLCRTMPFDWDEEKAMIKAWNRRAGEDNKGA